MSIELETRIDQLIRQNAALAAENARLQSVIDEANAQVVRADNAPLLATSDKVLFNGSHGHAGYVIEEQQSQAVAVPELDIVDGDILPPVGSSVAIHLASSDRWADHTVVGYYVWGPLGGVSDSYSRVFVRVVDDQGILNSRLLKDVQWDKNVPLRSIKKLRIKEESEEVNKYNFSKEWCENMAMLESQTDCDITAGVPSSPRITEQEDNLAVLVSQELYSNGGAHESQIDVARRIISFIASRLPNRVTEQDAREIGISAFRHMSKYGGRTLDTWLEETGCAMLDKLNGDKNAR